MSSFDALDGRTPVVVGAAEVVHRAGEGFVPSSATDLLIEAAEAALAQSGAAWPLGGLVGEVLTTHGTWVESDPGRAVAAVIGAPGARSVRFELGVLQLSLLGRAAQRVADGEVAAALVVGGENRWSGVVTGKAGTVLPEPPPAATAGEPDELVGPAEPIITPVEIERNLATAAHQYAIVESALRHHFGHTVEEHQRHLGALWENFARIAAEAPAAWDQRGLAADAIALVSESNRLIAAPYAKWLVSQWNVDQAAALVVTSVEVARRLDIPVQKWVFPLSLAVSNLVVPLSERAELHRWPAFAVCAVHAVTTAGVNPGAIAPIDLYSCFPVAIEIQAQELAARFGADTMGLDHPDQLRPLTLTGGMTFGGGPFNNYALQGAAAMVRTLQRAERGTVGLTSAVSGLLTKPAVAIWSTGAPTEPFHYDDLTAEADAASARRPVDPDLVGAAAVVGATVVPDRDGRLTTVALVESAAGVRTVAHSTDEQVGRRFLADDLVGAPVTLPEVGRFALT